MVKNLIFDMGNVIIDIDIPRTYNAFAGLAGISSEEATRLFHEKAFFHQYEIGKVSDAEFRDLMRREFSASWSDADIDTAWCALLLDMPVERLARIRALQQQYNVFLLSNTNAIHVREICRRAEALGYDFLSLFRIPFLSYEMGFMKPDSGFYEEALRRGNLLAEESLFIDDNADNIRAASSVGIQTIWLNPIGSLLDKVAHL